jgi:hypothetical protein
MLKSYGQSYFKIEKINTIGDADIKYLNLN